MKDPTSRSADTVARAALWKSDRVALKSEDGVRPLMKDDVALCDLVKSAYSREAR